MMRALLQRVSRAQVTIQSEVVATIGSGFLILLGVTHDDGPADATYLALKIANLRVFDDEHGNLNRSALDLATNPGSAAAMLVVSQFTLYADNRRGRRPSFVQAARPELAAPLVDHLAAELRGVGLTVAQGRFGADMAVELVNDGPVTIWLDTAELRA